MAAAGAHGRTVLHLGAGDYRMGSNHTMAIMWMDSNHTMAIKWIYRMGSNHTMAMMWINHTMAMMWIVRVMDGGKE